MSNRQFFTPERITKIVLALISLTLSGFLIGLGENFMADLDNWYQAPLREDFDNASALKVQKKQTEALDKEKLGFTSRSETIAKALEIARRNYDSEKQSFENWLQTRQTIGSPNEDPVVLQKAKELDRYRLIAADWQQKLDEITDSVSAVEKKQSVILSKTDEIRSEDEKKYERAMEDYGLKIFLVRLVIVLPILGIGIFAFVKFRKNKYAPLIWGYILFSLYIFFVGLVPYLPSYGGYIRYAVGIVLTVFVGYYLIKQLSAYAERKKAELQKSTQERAKQVFHDAAIRAYQAHSCPSCEKDYLIGKTSEKVFPEYCTHCGLVLFGKCSSCGETNFMHFPYCRTCGSPIKQVSKEDK